MCNLRLDGFNFRLDSICADNFTDEIRVRNKNEFGVEQLQPLRVVQYFFHFIGKHNLFLNHFVKRDLDIAQVVAELRILRKPEIPDDRREQEMIRVRQARLDVVVTHPFMQLPGNDVLVAHHFFVIELPESTARDAFRDKGIEPDKGAGLVALFLPILARLEPKRFENIGDQHGCPVLIRDGYVGSRADEERVLYLILAVAVPVLLQFFL